MPNKRIIIIAGHYGAGKTNVAVNLAMSYAVASPHGVAIIDMDTVNPYFRAADAKTALISAGIRPILPIYANTNVDVPALPAEIASVFCSDEVAVFDIGGDDGATALGVYYNNIVSTGYEMYCVINMYRPLTDTPDKAISVMREIEEYSRLRFTAIINNSNLGAETTRKTVAASETYALGVAAASGLPLIYTTVTENCESKDITNPFIIKNYTKQLF